MNRGSDNHLRVSNSTNITVDWKSFLRCDANKYSLFHPLADAIREFQSPQRKKLISTWPECCYLCHSRPLRPVLHSRISLNTASVPCLPFVPSCIYQADYNTRDSVVVVLAIAVSIVLQHCEIWVAFGHGSKLRFIPCHLIAAKLGNDGSWGLLLLHAL